MNVVPIMIVFQVSIVCLQVMRRTRTKKDHKLEYDSEDLGRLVRAEDAEFAEQRVADLLCRAKNETRNQGAYY